MKNCPNCKREIDDNLKKCPYCNFELYEKAEKSINATENSSNYTNSISPSNESRSNNQDCHNTTYFNPPANFSNTDYNNTVITNNKKHFNKKAIILVIILLAVLIIVIKISIPAIQYNNAKSNLENGNYDDAISTFTDLGDYKDSETLLLEAYYQAGMQAVDDSDFKLAKEYFTKCDGYSNADTALAMINLYNAYALCSSSRTSLSSDFQSITVDSKNKNDTESLSDIITIISALNLPDSLRNEMAHTTALMGVQEETFTHYTVRWTYHPDNGLDVIFKLT